MSGCSLLRITDTLPATARWRRSRERAVVPEMDIEVASGFLEYHDILARIIAYVFWPADEKRRRAYVARVYLHGFRALEEISPSELAVAAEPAWLWEKAVGQTKREVQAAIDADFRELAGGWAALLPALDVPGSADIAKNATAVRTAAAILNIVRTMAEQTAQDASINKAVHVIERTGRYHGLLQSRTPIWNAWREYKGICHLACALYYWAHKFPSNDDRDTIVDVGIILTVARDYQRFACRPPNPLLDHREIWAVPEDLLLPDCNIPQNSLPADMLEALSSYRAPAKTRRARLPR
jgi:hypothetical protein